MKTASSGNLLCRHDLRLFIAGGGSAQYLPARGQQSVKSAEMKLGFTLFQRVRGKLLPTSEAITLFEKAQSIYQDLDNLRLLADNLARDPRAKIHFRLSAKPGVKPGAGAGDRLLSAKQQLVMTLTTEHTETLVKKLDLREIDLALTLQPVQQGEIPATLIAEVPLVYIDRHYRQGRWRSIRSTSSAGSRRDRTRSLPPSPPVATFPPPG